MAPTIETPESALPSAVEIGNRRLFALARAALTTSVSAALVIGLWHVVVVGFEIPTFIMPTPGTAWQAFLESQGEIGAALAYTLRGAALGLALATVIALILAGIFASSETATRAVLPIVIGLRTAPVLAIAPILILIFGRGLGTSIAVVVIVAFFPIMVNAMRGFRAARRNALELMHVCGASGLQTFFKVRVPFALPFIFAGLRAASASAILSAMLAEWLSGAPGLGTLILDAAAFRNLGLLWATVVVSMLMAFSIFILTTTAERHLLSWTR